MTSAGKGAGGNAKDNMDDAYPARERIVERRRVRTRTIVAAALAALLVGAVSLWLLAGSPGFSAAGLFSAAEEPEAVAETGAPQAPAAAQSSQAAVGGAQPADAAVVQQGGLDQRMAALEQRLAQLDMQTQAAVGNAARAEGLLVTFAARRVIERGAPLGYLADQLRLRFGDAQPNAVQTIIDASQDPVTLDQLLARLDGLAPQLDKAPASEGAFSWLSRELGELFVVRREDAPSPASERRLERARLFLESGRAGAAAAEIRNLPNAEAAADWIGDAERYARVQRALELLETAAILEPRQLRDAEGRSVRQVSPVAGD